MSEVILGKQCCDCRYNRCNSEKEPPSLFAGMIELSILEKIKQFLRVSTVFKSIGALELLTVHADPAKTLYVMEVYEWTYRKSKKTVDKPLFLLRKGLKAGVTPDKVGA